MVMAYVFNSFDMLISVVVPVYNVSNYIVDCLRSVAEQDYNGSVECILVDDCGIDDSIDKAYKFIDEVSSNIDFRIVHHQINKGLSGARNTGILEAQGDFLFFLDSDDQLTADCLSVMAETLSQNADADLVQAGVLRSTGGFVGLDFEQTNFPDCITEHKKAKKMLLGRQFPCMAFPRLIRKTFLIDNNLFFREGILNEDELWRFYLAKKVKRLAVCHKNTYNYTVREGSIMTKTSNTRYESVLKVCDEMLDHLDHTCLNDQVYMIAQILENTCYATEDSTNRSRLLNLLSRCSVYASPLLRTKLRLYVAFYESSLRKNKLLAYLFYICTVLK